MYPEIQFCEKCKKKGLGYVYDYFAGTRVDTDDEGDRVGISSRKKYKLLGQHKSFICNSCRWKYLAFRIYFPILFAFAIYLFLLAKSLFYPQWKASEYLVFASIWTISFVLYILVSIKIKSQKIPLLTILSLYVIIPVIHLLNQFNVVDANTYRTVTNILVIISLLMQIDILIYVKMSPSFLMETWAGRINKQRLYNIYGKEAKGDLMTWNNEELEDIW